MKKQVELSITHNGKDVVTYPYTKKEHVQFENGMNIDEFVGQDIATPTITHDTTAIKVGVGDSDVSSSVVDSAVNMTIKGQTYQNILPEPTLRNEMQGKSMQRLNEGYDSIETVDGVSKSAILKGQTLVNVNIGFISTWGGKIVSKSEVSSVNRATTTWDFDKTLLKSNTKYLIIYNCNNSLTNNIDRGIAVYCDGGASGYATFTNGLNSFTFTSGDLSVSSNRVYLGIQVGTGNECDVTISDIMILEYQDGMENWDIPYFEGMQSVKMPVLKTTGKNLCKYRSDWVNNGLTFAHTNDGVTVNGTATAYVDYYVTTKDGSINAETLDVLNSLQVGTRLFLSNNLGKNSYISYRLNGETKYRDNVTIQNGMEIIGVFVRFQQGDICNNLNLTIQLEIGNEATSYEPHKSNILRTPEEVVLKGLGDVQDTLNVNTGEYVQRIKEIVLNGAWFTEPKEYDNFVYRYQLNDKVNDNYGLIADVMEVFPVNWTFPKEGLYVYGKSIFIALDKEKHPNASSLEQFTSSWIPSNPITVQYKLETPIIKTVDLSSHGNWEKVVLNGSENWRHESSFTHDNLIEFKLTIGNGNIASVISDRFATGGNDVERIACTAHGVYIRILKSKVSSLDEFKAWLQQNPVTVWYQTTTTQDNSIREMLSFANGHLQVSSEAENSLLPTVQYEIPTKNSYHMDLMKANTVYTMKLASGNGSINKWDGEAIGFMLSRTFNSGTLPKDNLFYTTGWVNDLMILEGDLNAKTIPYFKGIKSAFEGEDKIEVLSTGKNLFDIDKYALDNNLTRVGEDGLYINRVSTNLGTVDIQYKKKTQYVVGYQSYELLTTNDNWTPTIQFKYSDGTQEQLYLHTGNRKVSNVNKDVVEINIQNPWANVTANVYGIYVEEFPSDTTYEPHKSNTTKIPLLSPLRSLPNGMYDEIILDRENNEAKIIQRIGEITLDGSEDERWSTNSASSEPSLGLQGFIASHNDYQSLTPNRKQYGVAICDTLPTVASVGREGLFNGLGINIITSRYSFTHEHKEWLSKNPTTVLYELETPIITGIDLEGYPYAYKDGHIFLNSDIAPTTQITYSINQAQQIESANENLQRHEKEISHLQKLIAQYIQVEYESTLLSLKI